MHDSRDQAGRHPPGTADRLGRSSLSPVDAIISMRIEIRSNSFESAGPGIDARQCLIHHIIDIMEIDTLYA